MASMRLSVTLVLRYTTARSLTRTIVPRETWTAQSRVGRMTATTVTMTRTRILTRTKRWTAMTKTPPHRRPLTGMTHPRMRKVTKRMTTPLIPRDRLPKPLGVGPRRQANALGPLPGPRQQPRPTMRLLCQTSRLRLICRPMSRRYVSYLMAENWTNRAQSCLALACVTMSGWEPQIVPRWVAFSAPSFCTPLRRLRLHHRRGSPWQTICWRVLSSTFLNRYPKLPPTAYWPRWMPSQPSLPRRRSCL
mmetsp:Transcript_25924/g.68032  ORF Transcript_25924/g.68032 Transcript_25924/m.68032 type:complete len:248 (+) Transcript_25924:402-1145(+)